MWPQQTANHWLLWLSIVDTSSKQLSIFKFRQHSKVFATAQGAHFLNINVICFYVFVEKDPYQVEVSQTVMTRAGIL